MDEPKQNISPPDRVKWNDDFFSTSTLDECEKHFEEYFENNIDQLAETKDKLSLLRSCIELLNRLEGTSYDLFAGRVLVFLARVIPLFDQSGVNLRSEFSSRTLPGSVVANLEKIGAQNAEKDKQLSQLIEHDMEEGETISDDESNESVPNDDSDKIYERFWKIQKLLHLPSQLYDKNTWLSFRTQVDTLVCKMENTPATLKVWSMRGSYMTNAKSLALQFNDVNMRRCFLLQILIAFQYLETPADTKPENFVLDKVQMSWQSTVTRRIFGLLDKMPNQEEGRKFLFLVRQIFKRELMWNRWKNDKCKEAKKTDEEEEIINMRGTYHKRRKISDELSAAKAYNMHVIGSPEMSRLWNMKPVQKFITPNLNELLNSPIEKLAEDFKDPNYSFRALRLFRKSPYFFAPSQAVIQPLDGYLNAAASRLINGTKQTKVINE